jgi:predicted PurR-regulated permease PerM
VILERSSSSAVARAVFFSLILLLFVAILMPLIVPVLMGGIFAIVLWPFHARLLKRKIPAAVSAAVVTLGVSVLFFLPAVFVGLQTAKVVRNYASQFGRGVELLDFETFLPRVEERLSALVPMDWSGTLASARELLETLGKRAAELIGSGLAQIPGVVMALLVTVLSLYFLLLDGPRLLARVRAHSFFSPQKTDRILAAVHGLSRGVIVAQLATGFAQTLVFSLFCFFAGVGQVGVISVLVFVMSFIPLIGAAPLTFGIALVQLLSGATSVGIVLLIGALIASTLDNVVRPWVLKDAGELHPLVAFIAAFGGLQVLGPMGVFIGPIAAGLFMVTLRLMVTEN